MPTFTGVEFIDWLILTAATLTALSVIYLKGVRPIFRFFQGVSRAIDHIEQVPEITASIVKVNERIDAHMETEEASLTAVKDSIGAIEGSLEQRTALWAELKQVMEVTQGVLSDHMQSDTEQFAAASELLTKGQDRIDGRLERIENKLEGST